jgi:hypothetical protein
MNARRGIFNEGQDRSSVVGDHTVAEAGHNPTQRSARMLHRQAFRQVGAIESPGIDDLLAVGVDDFHLLTFRQQSSLAFSGWDGDQRRRSHSQHSLVSVIIGVAHKIST